MPLKLLGCGFVCVRLIGKLQCKPTAIQQQQNAKQRQSLRKYTFIQIANIKYNELKVEKTERKKEHSTTVVGGRYLSLFIIKQFAFFSSSFYYVYVQFYYCCYYY